MKTLLYRTVAEMQKTETKNSKAKDVFDKVKTDIRYIVYIFVIIIDAVLFSSSVPVGVKYPPFRRCGLSM